MTYQQPERYTLDYDPAKYHAPRRKTDVQMVLPRDFFNVSKLLKCLGRLALKIEDDYLEQHKVKHWLEEVDDCFLTEYDSKRDIFYCSNYRLTANQNEIEVGTIARSKEPYPLIFISERNLPDEDEEQYVFNDEGEFTQEFIRYLEWLNTLEPDTL